MSAKMMRAFALASRSLSCLVWLVALAIPAQSFAAQLDTVTATPIQPVARESNPTGAYGQVAFRRTSALASLTVTVTVDGSAYFDSDPLFTDYTLSGVDADPDFFTNQTTVTFLPGELTHVVKVFPVLESSSTRAPELEDTVKFTIEPQPTLYVVGGEHTVQISIADGNIQCRARVTDSVFAERQSVLSPAVALNTDGGSIAYDFSDVNAPFGSRNLEVLVNDTQGGVNPAATATLGTTVVHDNGTLTVTGGDYGLIYFISGARDADGTRNWGYHAKVKLDAAYRPTNEYNQLKAGAAIHDDFKTSWFAGQTTSVVVSGGGEPAGGVFDAGTYYITYNGSTYTYDGSATPANDTFTIATDENGNTVLKVKLGSSTGPFSQIIKYGDGIKAHWEVTTTTVSGTPSVTVVTVAKFDKTWKVTENTMYDATKVITAVTLDSSTLHVGDVFEFSNDPGNLYRVTGPTPAVAGGTVGTVVTFTPSLNISINRDTLPVWVRTEFAANFKDSKSGVAWGRQMIHIPGLPTGPSPVYPLAAGTLDPLTGNTAYVDPMPRGDSVEFVSLVTDDVTVEGAELIQLTLQDSPQYDIVSPQQASVYIADDDAIASVRKITDAGEPSYAGSFRITMNKAFDRDVTIRYAVTGDANYALNTPTASAGIDYTLDGLDATTGIGVVTLTAGQLTKDITLTPISDGVSEATEQVRLSLLPSRDFVLAGSDSGDTNASAATMSIADLIGTVAITQSASSMQEYDTAPTTPVQVIFNLTRSSTLYDSAQIQFTTSGTATAGIDYTVDFVTTGATGSFDNATGIGSISIPSGVSNVQAKLTLFPINDAIVEPPLDSLGNHNSNGESVTFQLVGVPGLSLSSTPGSTSTTVSILDDEPMITITKIEDAAEPSTSGGSPANVGSVRLSYVSTLSTGIGRDVKVYYSVTGTATSGVDYTALTAFATIAAGSTTQDISISPLFDVTKDPDETVVVTILNGAGYYPDLTYGKATVKIKEYSASADSGDAVAFQATSMSIDATSQATAAVQVARLTSNGTLTVNYTTQDGTGIAGSTYSTRSGTLTWADGDTSSRVVLVPIFGMTAEKTFTVLLSNASSTTGSSASLVANTIRGVNPLPIKVSALPDDSNSVEVSKSSNGANGCGSGSNGIALMAMGALLFTIRARSRFSSQRH